MGGRRRSLSLVLNGTFDRALQVAAELEDCLLLARDRGSGGADGTLFRARVLARDLENAFMDALAIRAPLVGDYDGALGSARDLVTVLRRVYPLAFELDDGRYAGVKSNVDHAFACAQVFVTVLEMAQERGPGEPDLAVVSPSPDGSADAEEMEEQVREQWARILPFEGDRDR
ncbi:hypothetical protein FHX44_112047 [Pseudonocardia hierapolitana]|uniref:Uncharacterized protein n=1 Tax=Pseudonocardia hierapolitana TaxID=1128676 RepID=A0A561SMR8_9PSEU|nr:hypothetical protein [Pseudonocardia hierapolitana]TWF76159.1 hypothetical protein FHX44_112047 [Pseudonocardia hierapolitana]